MGGIASANSEYKCGKPGRLIIKLNIGEIQTTLSTHMLVIDDGPIFPYRVSIKLVQGLTSLYRLNINT